MGGGGPKSLKVVRMPDWLAEVWILSRAWANCSLSIGEEVDWLVTEPRREMRSNGDDRAPGDGGGLFEEAMLMWCVCSGRVLHSWTNQHGLPSSQGRNHPILLFRDAESKQPEIECCVYDV